MRFSKNSAFLLSISSVSRSFCIASWGVGCLPLPLPKKFANGICLLVCFSDIRLKFKTYYFRNKYKTYKISSDSSLSLDYPISFFSLSSDTHKIVNHLVAYYSCAWVDSFRVEKNKFSHFYQIKRNGKWRNITGDERHRTVIAVVSGQEGN